MWHRWIAVGVACAALWTADAQAEVRIVRDPGGQIGPYLHAFARVRDSGERVVIDGPCMSACTLVLGVVPADRICATPRALLGFHAAWIPDADGRPVTSAAGTDALWSVYPDPLRRWIARKGGLTRKIIYLRGKELASIVPACRR